MTPLERRLAALRQDLEAIGKIVDGGGHVDASRRAEARTILRRALDQLDAAEGYPSSVEVLPDRPTAEVEVPLGAETAPPQVVRLDVTGCAGADRLIVRLDVTGCAGADRLIIVVDLGMGSPRWCDTNEEAIVSAGTRCLALRPPEAQDRRSPSEEAGS